MNHVLPRKADDESQNADEEILEPLEASPEEIADAMLDKIPWLKDLLQQR